MELKELYEAITQKNRALSDDELDNVAGGKEERELNYYGTPDCILTNSYAPVTNCFKCNQHNGYTALTICVHFEDLYSKK